MIFSSRMPTPAAMTSYTLDIGSVSEPQRSSGLWIATAAGSTAAIRAAGGCILPLRSRKLQYLVRGAVQRRPVSPPAQWDYRGQRRCS